MGRAWVAASLLVAAACGDVQGTDGGGGDVDGARPDARSVCASDAECEDGLFCNGAERCAPGDPAADGRGCVAAAPPCLAEQTCDEAARRCLTDCDLTGDADGDGHLSVDCGGDDCDDADVLRFPGNVEVCDADGHDEDCDPSTFGGRDADGDGVEDAGCCNTQPDGSLACGEDCDDRRREVHPFASEVCDRVDNDCDGDVDEGVRVDGYADADRDLHGDGATPLSGCPGDVGLSALGDDCDDTNPAVHSAQPELCDGIDNDCDGEVDEGAGAQTWYRDLDGDGFGSEASGTVVSCAPVAGHRLLGTDCDDTDPAINPGAAEVCDARDNDCNGRPDYHDGTTFEDDDRDGYPDAACAPDGVAADCDDTDPTTYPGAPPLADGRDHDCDGLPDSGCVAIDVFPDADRDGWGEEGSAPIRACEVAPGQATRAGDCDDADPARHPAALDLCNGIDDDCDGAIDEGSSRLCWAPRALGLCTAEGECEVALCAWGWGDCLDGTGPLAAGCESNLRDSDDGVNCGACGTFCSGGPNGLPACRAGSCALVCAPGYGDCDGSLATGCESELPIDRMHCGACGVACSDRPHGSGSCAAGACGVTCDAGWADCDGDLANGCEVNVARDAASCGACGSACAIGTDVCVDGSCTAPAFPSDGSMGPFAPSADVELPAGVYHFTTITIPVGVTVRTDGAGRLELRATGAVVIDGIIDVSGGEGAPPMGGLNGGGGASGAPIAGLAGVACTGCCPAGPGGDGAPGASAAAYPGRCGEGGARGGGAAGLGDGTGIGSGGGGGGYAGGSGGGRSSASGAGASVAGLGTGGASVSSGPGRGGEEGLRGGPLDAYAGRDAGALGDCVGAGGSGGGGSIGAGAAMDLAVGAATFNPGSGGGGGAGGGNSSQGYGNGAGGGGAGGALRIASSVSIRIGGSLLARGGAGGGVSVSGRGGAGGGGSGGVVYLAAPRVEVNGAIDTAGGARGMRATGCAGHGGAGGLGRIRLSVLEEECAGGGAWTPTLASCAPSPAGGTPGEVYVARYPN